MPASIACDYRKVGLIELEAGRQWWRIHHRKHPSLQFNDSKLGNARFSPFFDTAGNVIPTIYAAADIRSALMETVLHDAPSPAHGFIYLAPVPEQRVLVQLTNKLALRLANLQTLGLRRAGIKRADLIDSEKPAYTLTRAFARALHAARPDVQGLSWHSRQNHEEVIVLFGDRIAPANLAVVTPAVSVAEDSVQLVLLELLAALGASSL